MFRGTTKFFPKNFSTQKNVPVLHSQNRVSSHETPVKTSKTPFGDFSYVQPIAKRKFMEDAVKMCGKFDLWDEYKSLKFCVCSYVPTSHNIFVFEKIIRADHPTITQDDIKEARCALKTIADHGWDYFDAVGAKQCDYHINSLD